MTAKEYLQQYRKAELRLNDLEGQLYITRVKMEGLSGCGNDIGPVQGTPLADKLGALYGQYEAQQLAMEAEVEQLKNTMLDVRLAISYVKDYRLRSLLEYKYLFGRTWDWIAEQMHHHPVYVRRDLHGAALNALKIAT